MGRLEGVTALLLLVCALVAGAAGVLEGGCREVGAEPPACTSETTLHPHPADCARFYRCDQGRVAVLTCPRGLRFDPSLAACYPLAACSPACVPQDGAKDEVAAPEDYDVCGDTPTCIAFEWGQTKPYPPDCSMFILCDVLGNAVLESCPEGLHYSPQASQCTSPEEAECMECEVLTTVADTE